MRAELARPVERARTICDRHGGLVAAGLWFLAYVLVVATGQRFSIAYLDFGWQLVPWDILVHDPIRSVWYLHTQPPLWNLTLGCLAAVSPFSDRLTLQALQLVIGLLLVAVLPGILRALRVGPLTAVLLALVATLNPEVLGNAFSPTYELAVALLVALVVRTFQMVLARRDTRSLVLLACALTALVLTRSLYHPLLIVVILGAAMWALRHHVSRRSLAVAAAVPVLLVGGWMLKNEALYGRATLSSWFGMNLQRSTIPILPKANLDALHAEGRVTDIATIGPFGNYGLYRDHMPPCTPTVHHPSITTEGHSLADGTIIPNFNYQCFLPVFDKAEHDFWVVAKEYPGVWLRGRWFSLKMTFATSNLAADSHSRPFRALDAVYRFARVDAVLTESTVDWGQPLYGRLAFPFHFSMVVVVIYATLGVALLLALRRRWRQRLGADLLAQGTVAVTALLAVFTVVVGIVGELGEQARFRSVTDPVALSVGGVVLARAISSWISGRAARPADD